MMSLNDQIGIDDIYIVHGIRGYEQREAMLNEMLGQQLKLNYQFVTEHENNAENEELIKEYFVPDIREKLPKGALFCTLVHFLCYEKFLQSTKNYAIILENDICLLGDFISGIKRVITEARQVAPGFIISLENSTLKFPSVWETRKEKMLYPAERGRCAGAYLIDRTATENMLESLKNSKCNKVIDWWHNDLINRGTVKMYWAHPPLIEQGSFNGKFNSSISSRADGLLRSIKWRLQKFYKMYIRRIFP